MNDIKDTWIPQVKGDPNGDQWEISVVRESNEHGIRSWGWFNENKLLISHNGAHCRWPLAPGLGALMINVAEKYADYLNQGGNPLEFNKLDAALTDEQKDQKECQETFEQWSIASNMPYSHGKYSDDLVAETNAKDDVFLQNPYMDVRASFAYEGWRAAWKNRAAEFEKGFNAGIDTVMTVLDEEEPDDRVRQIKDSIRDSINEELDLMASDG